MNDLRKQAELRLLDVALAMRLGQGQGAHSRAGAAQSLAPEPSTQQPRRRSARPVSGTGQAGRVVVDRKAAPVGRDRRRWLAISAAVAAVVIGFGLIAVAMFRDEPVAKPPYVRPAGPSPALGPAYLASKDARLRDEGGVIALDAGWIFFDASANGGTAPQPVIRVAEHRLEPGVARGLVVAGQVIDEQTLEPLHVAIGEQGAILTQEETDMIKDIGHWTIRGALALCVLSGGVMLDGETIGASRMKTDGRVISADEDVTRIEFEGVETAEQLMSLDAGTRAIYLLNVTDDTLKHLERFKSLVRLTLVWQEGTAFTTAGLASLSKLESLVDCAISDFSGRGGVPLEPFATLPKLERLTVTFGEQHAMSNAALEVVSRMKTLKHLELGDCSSFKGKEFTPIEVLSGLETLILGNCFRMDDAGLAPISRLTNLKKLSLDECEAITDAGVEQLSPLKNLESLTLFSSISDDGLQHIGRLASLTNLVLGGIADGNPELAPVTDAGFRHLAGLKKLERIEIVPNGSMQITGSGFKHLNEATGLKGIVFNGDIGDAGALEISKLPVRLETLVLRSCKGIKDAGARGIFSMKSLTSLELNRASGVSRAALSQIVALTNLTTLTLTEAAVDNALLGEIAGKVPLEKITLVGCDAVTDEGIDHLEAMKSLKWAGVWLLKNVSDARKDSFMKKLAGDTGTIISPQKRG